MTLYSAHAVLDPLQYLEPNVPVSDHGVAEVGDFREGSQSQKGPRTPEQERKEETTAESDTDEGGTSKGKGEENKDKMYEFLGSGENMHVVRTISSVTKDSPTNANVDAENSRHEQLKAIELAEDAEQVRPGKTSDVPGKNQDKVQALIKGFNSEVVSGNNDTEKVVGRWQSSEAGSSEYLGGVDDEGDHEPQPKRSAMRTNSSEGKRKSVSFLQKNGEAEKDVDEGSTAMKYDPVDSMSELETERLVYVTVDQYSVPID